MAEIPTPHTTPPPNYRRADINPMTQILEDKSALMEFEGPPTVNLTAGTPAFGAIPTETPQTFSFDSSSEDWFVGVLIKYVGDNGAFRLDGIGGVTSSQALVSGTFALLTAVPGSDSGQTLDLVITALAADSGMAKSGTLTFYDRYTDGPFTPSRSVATLALSKTYTP